MRLSEEKKKEEEEEEEETINRMKIYMACPLPYYIGRS